jgi:hypothetical protein
MQPEAGGGMIHIPGELNHYTALGGVNRVE